MLYISRLTADIMVIGYGFLLGRPPASLLCSLLRLALDWTAVKMDGPKLRKL